MSAYDFSIDKPHLRYNYTWLLPVEKRFDPIPPTVWMQQNWKQSIILSVLYVIFIYGGRYLMRNRQGYELKRPLIYWNIGLAIFSILGTVRFAPDFVWSLYSHGFVHSICVCNYHHGVTGFWTEMFAMSKAIELGDTAFLVLRKRPIIFLHWYHHITVMIYTWHAFKDHTAAGRWFIMMNYTVHSLMYSYYALRAAGFRFPKFIPMAVTISQLSQMVVGIVVAIATYNVKSGGGDCQQTMQNLQVAFAMYFSYFLLFAHFFYKVYFKTRKYDKDGLKQASSSSKALKQDANGMHKVIQNGDLVSNGAVKHEANGTLGIVANGFDKSSSDGGSTHEPSSKGDHSNGFLETESIDTSMRSASRRRKYD